tara:strand:- start:3071 stop:5884 length:2814 start_codon:yes stop_codon:yes gene_type:complete
MSTQLILYPQYYNGFNSTSSTYNQFVVNGSFFTNLNSTDLHSTTYIVPYQSAMYSQPPSIVNTWYRFTTTGGGATWGAVTAPQEALNNLVLSYNGTTIGHTGVYQQMSGLVVGADYDVVIDIDTAAVGILGVRIFEGASLTLTNVSYYSSNVSLITHTFTCTNTNQTLFLDYASTTASLIIDSIKCTEGGQSPTQTYSDLQDGQVICDLYQEEDIPLTLSIDEFKNAAEKVQSYSKDFDLPATKRNNQIFDNIFEITRTDTGINFNPYVKTKCTLKQNGFILFDGYLRLINIKDKEGEISYNVNLYSEVIALADTLKDLKFSALNFSELGHEYNKTNIKNSWYNTTGIELTTPLPSTSSYAYSSAIGNLTNTNVLKYPFVDWTGNIGIADGTGSAILNMPELSKLESAFRPFIQIRYLINKIFEFIPFTWSSDFFDTSDFGNLFMDFNWGAGNAPALTGGGTTPYTAFWLAGSGQADNIATTSYTTLNVYVPIPFIGGNVPPNYNTSTNIITATQANEIYDITYNYRVEQYVAGTFGTECRWLHTNGVTGAEIEIDYSGVQTLSSSGSLFTYSGTFSIILQPTDTLQAQFKATSNTSLMQYNGVLGDFGAFLEITTTTLNTVGWGTLNLLRGELGQWEFLKGIMTMFNLVSMPDPDNPNNIIFEPYSDIFITDTAGTNLAARGIQHDWTDKVDVSEMELKPLTDLNKKTIFKYVEDEEDNAFKIYKNANSGYLYGSLEYAAINNATGVGFTVLDGKDEIVAEPFAATVIKPLYTQFSNFIVPQIYASNDGTYGEYENAPRIVTINTRKELSGGATYFIPEQNGLSNENQTHFLQCSHLSEIPTAQLTTTDINFGTCQLVNPLVPVLNNLFNLYWLPYYNELYNADTRTMTLKVSLTPADINTFKFNDKVMIKNRVFRVNKIEYKPNDLAKVEFILIP